MKKIFTLIAMALMTVGAIADTLIKYDGEEKATEGITLAGTTVMGSAKTETNTVTTNAIKLANGYTSEGSYSGNAIILDYTGGFKAGDVLTIKGFINHSETTKQGGVCIFTVEEVEEVEKATMIDGAHSSIFLNGRYENGLTEWTYTLEEDMDQIFIGRYAEANATSTYVAYLTVERGVVIENEAPKVSIPETMSAYINSEINIAATATGRPAPEIKWYSNTSASNNGGTEIGEGTSYKFTADTEGTYYIYAVATNTEGSSASGVCTIEIKDPTIIVSENDEIIFPEGLSSLDGVIFKGGALTLAVTGSMVTEANKANFGTEEQYSQLTSRLKTGGKSSSTNNLVISSTKAGKLYIYARSASASATDRNIVFAGTSTLLDQILKDADAVTATKINSEGEEEKKTVFPVYSIDMPEGDVNITYPVGAINIYALSLDKDITTSINSVSTVKAENSAIYNALGQRVNANAKGIMIQNGKKYIAK